MTIDSILSGKGSNDAPCLANKVVKKLSNLVNPNKTPAIIKQKENAFPLSQNLNNMKNRISKNTQNNGL
jgi:ribosomal protein S30